MRRSVFLILLFLISLSSCNGQKKKNEPKDPVKDQPKEDVVVNKEYDDNGNLIRYDSTYTYFYSNAEDPALKDSILNNFKKHFNQVYTFSNDPEFDDFFFQDSLMEHEFYNNDFFFKQFQNNMKEMDFLFRQMDSLKNSFYRDQFFDEKNRKKNL